MAARRHHPRRAAPAARLSETEIGNRLGVSRQPVREAFIRLTAEG